MSTVTSHVLCNLNQQTWIGVVCGDSFWVDLVGRVAIFWCALGLRKGRVSLGIKSRPLTQK